MTPAILAVRRAGVPYRVLEYAHDPRSPSCDLETVHVSAGRRGLEIALAPAVRAASTTTSANGFRSRNRRRRAGNG
jgi:hypothetical protein